ncbi:RadC family protein [Methylophaga thiooxydans]|uniref:RadC family protein n=1 Tax=Methylophaga thiooxydans TaxID=392484 RepID=UPI002353A881|nr:DNA repair protein RadC [Methylophaga thiooxydans]
MATMNDNTTLVATMSSCPLGFEFDDKGLLSTERPVTVDELIEAARRLIKERFENKTELTTVEQVRAYLSAKLEPLEHEVFCCIFLDNKNRVIQLEELFRGTLDGASVYPREVVKRVLHFNAAAIIVAHNHPSGVSEPSASDVSITSRLKQSLELVGVRLLDHFVIGAGEITSFAQMGKL